MAEPFRWDATALRYRAPSGRFVAESAVRQAVDTVVDMGSARLASLTQALVSGATDLATWQTTMAQELKTLHLATATAAQGGWAQMSPADFGRVGGQLRQQYAFLRDFAAAVADGSQALDGRAVARARLYGQAARGTYEATRRDAQMVRGGQERRVLHAAESCPDCEGFAARGWQPLGTLPGIGQASVCRANCRCTFAFRAVQQAAA